MLRSMKRCDNLFHSSTMACFSWSTVLNFRLDLLLKGTPNSIINAVKIRAVWRPHLRLDEWNILPFEVVYRVFRSVWLCTHHPAGASVCTDDIGSYIRHLMKMMWVDKNCKYNASSRGRKLRYQKGVTFWHTLYNSTSYHSTSLVQVTQTCEHRSNRKAVLSQGNRAMPQLFFGFKVRRQHSHKFKSSQAPKARLQSYRHTGAKKLLQNSHFKVTYLWVSGKSTKDWIKLYNNFGLIS